MSFRREQGRLRVTPSVNANGLTFVDWLNAAEKAKLSHAWAYKAAWQRGDDPCEWKADKKIKLTKENREEIIRNWMIANKSDDYCSFDLAVDAAYTFECFEEGGTQFEIPQWMVEIAAEVHPDPIDEFECADIEDDFEDCSLD